MIQESCIQFDPTKLLDQLLDISRKKFIFFKKINSELSCIEVLITDKNSKVLEIEDKISITLVIT